MKVNAYRVPIGGPIDVLVLEYKGQFYSFGQTLRSAKSVWKEVNDKLEHLDKCNDMKDEIVPHFYESFEGELK